MPLHITNSLTKKKELFVPLREGHVGVYVCGPTVYGHAHIGHAKSYISFDVVVRYLRHLGYKVRYVQNITDVGHLTDDTVGMADEGEDKVLKQAQIEQVEPMELVERYTRSYFEDMDRLNVLRPDISPRASAHIPEQIDLIERLIDRGLAYAGDGSVYFSIRDFRDYGRLSGRDYEEQEAGARVAVDERKRDPRDFYLWRRAAPEHLLRWKSPWGVGYPGWHIECSAMSMRYLGETFDIHGGGLVNMFPHHECEIAQSEGVTEKPFVRVWMHNNMVTVNGVKMGKSLGNYTTIKDALREVDPQTLRLFYLNSHYRSVQDFSMEAIVATGRGMERLRRTIQALDERCRTAPDREPDRAFNERLKEARRAFAGAMDDDFNTAQAVGVLFDLSRDVNAALSAETLGRKDLEAAREAYAGLGEEVLGLDFREPGGASASNEAEESLLALLLDLRQEFRAQKNWAMADRVRDRLADLGYLIEDGPHGARWRRRESSP